MMVGSLTLLMLAATPAFEVTLAGGSRTESLRNHLSSNVDDTVAYPRYAFGAGLRYATTLGTSGRIGPVLTVFFVTPGEVEVHLGGHYEHTLWHDTSAIVFSSLVAALTMEPPFIGGDWGLAGGAGFGLRFPLSDRLELIIRGEALVRIYFQRHWPRFFPVMSGGLRF